MDINARLLFIWVKPASSAPIQSGRRINLIVWGQENPSGRFGFGLHAGDVCLGVENPSFRGKREVFLTFRCIARILSYSYARLFLLYHVILVMSGCKNMTRFKFIPSIPSFYYLMTRMGPALKATTCKCCNKSLHQCYVETVEKRRTKCPIRSVCL